MKKNTFGLRSGLALLLAVSILLSVAPVWVFAQRAGTENLEELPSDSVKSAPQTVSAQDIDGLLEQIGNLPEAAALGEYYDHTVHKSANDSSLSKSVNGTFFLVNVLTGKDGKLYAFAMDPTMPSTYGHFPAIPVTLTGTDASGLPTGGTTLSGVTEGMAITISSPTNNKWHTLQLHGPYDKMDEDFFIHGRVYNGSKTMMTLYPETGNGSYVQGDGSYLIALDDRGVNGSRRVSFTYQGPKESNGPDYYHYIGLNTSDPEDPDMKYFLTTNISAPVGATGYVSFSNYYTQSGNPTLEQVDSYLFRLLSDRVDTSALYQVLTSLTEVLTWDDRYDPTTYEALTIRAREALELYVSYNGRSFSAEELPGAREEVNQATRDLTNLSAVLKVNKSTDRGISISHFNANMYRWDELGMNNITRQKDPTGKKGFYFSDAPGDGANNKNYSYFSRFISDNEYRQVLEFDGVKYAQVLQNFGIYSGLALPKLTDDGLPQADTEEIVVPDLWSPTDLTDANGTELRKVYSDVSLPFMYDPETGYYTLSSNSNAVFFEGEPASGATLQISDKPALINTGYGSYETTGYSKLGGGTTELGKVDTYGLYDSYSTAFQPFATMTNKEWKGFISISPMTFQPKTPEDGYLLDGIPHKDTYTYGEMGEPAYSMGMVLEVKFNMTEDGLLEGDPITFNFGGDDDVWVYIDDELVLDIGGVHSAMQGSIDFSSGTVTVWNERFNRVVDIAGGDYTQRTDLYDFETSIEQTLNGVTYGSAIKDLSIITAMDETGLYPRLYQKNLYTGEADNVAASAELIKEFSQEGTHTMKIFYMDRGRSRTNCHISFNMPQPDKLVVDKEVNDFYGQIVDGEMNLTTDGISAQVMGNLETEKLSFVLTEDGSPIANAYYEIVRDNQSIGEGKTDSNGVFTIYPNSQARFEGLHMEDGARYEVVEQINYPWGTPAYSYQYTDGSGNILEGTDNGFAATGTGVYTTETLTIRCINTWCSTNLLGEPQKVVLDYGKPVNIPVLRNAVVNGASETVVEKGEILQVSFLDADKDYGTAELLDLEKEDGKNDHVRFTPLKMLDRVILLNCELRLSFETGEVRTVMIPVYVMPATTVYYETDFLHDPARALTLEVGGIYEQSRPWKTEGESQEELQDDGTVGDQIFTPEILKKSEKIPSNAFFADFDGKGYAERYSKHRVYGGVDFDKTAAYMTADFRISKLEVVDNALEMYLADNRADAYSRYVHTNDAPLFYSPGPNDYVQVRFRMVDCEIGPEDENMKFLLSVHRANDGVMYNDRDVDYIFSEGEIDRILAGEYVTVTHPLSNNKAYMESATVKGFSFHFQNVAKKSDSSRIIVDYLYVGPLTEEGSAPGQNMELHGATCNELFFGFENSMLARERYTTNSRYQIGTSTRNYDLATYWAANTSTKATTTVDNGAGVLKVNVSDTATADAGKFGPYVGITTTSGKFPTTDAANRQYDPLRFVPTPGEKTYFYVRFKYTNCKKDGDTTMLFRPLGKNSSGATVSAAATANFTFSENERYITVKMDVTNVCNTVVSSCGSVQGFYFRPRNVRAKDGKTGTLTIDYIYLGPEKEAFRRNAFIDFTNSYNALFRYSAPIHDGVNLDDPAHWVTEYFTTQVKNGVMQAVPTEKQNNEADGYGQFYPNNTFLNYQLNGKDDVVVIRARFTGVKPKGGTPALRLFIGPKRGFWATSETGHDKATIDLTFDCEKDNGKWIEFEYNVSSLKQYFAKVATIAIAVSYCSFNSGGKLEIDYVYIGSKAEMKETMDYGKSVLMQFDNTPQDQARYRDSLYSGMNYDLAKNWGNGYFNMTNEDGCLKLTPTDSYTKDAAHYGSVYPKYETNQSSAALNYRLTGNDRLEMRVKFVNAEYDGSGEPHFQLLFGPDLIPYTTTGNSWATASHDANRATMKLDPQQIADGDWITLQYDLTGHPWLGQQPEVIRFLIMIFRNIKFNSGGHILVDYIYLGPSAAEPSRSLFFGFADQETDRIRYSSHVYCLTNYDQGNWVTNADVSNGGLDYSIDTENGVLHLNVQNKTTGVNGAYGPYLITTNAAGQYGFLEARKSLSYNPKDAQYAQIRFRLNNCREAPGKEAKLLFLPGGYDKEGVWKDYNALGTNMYLPVSFVEGYQTLTIPITDTVRNLQSLTNMGVRFINVLGTGEGSIDIDYIYVGPGEPAPEPVYGYDSSYTNDDTLSNGSSWVVEGSGVKVNDKVQDYTQAQFRFRGTGFDLISRTGPEQATIRVQIWKEGAQKATKTVTVNNKGELDLHQIPVVSVEGLEYGNYIINVWVNKAITNSAVEALNRGGQFFFDAVRIYEPMGPDYDADSLFADAYKRDKEAYPHVKEIRNILLSAENFAQLMGEGNGALFIDAHKPTQEDAPATDANGSTTEGSGTAPGTQLDDHYVADVQTYSKLGPKNEVYLAPKQAVAFRLDISTSYIPTSVDIGVKKIAPGEEGMFAVGVVSKDSTSDSLNITYRREIKVTSAAAQYYELKITPDNLFTRTVDGKTVRYCYIVLYNDSQASVFHDPGEGDGEHILSVTDVKVAYEQMPEEGLPKDQLTDPELRTIPKREIADTYFDFTVDGQTLEAAVLFMKAVLETPVLVEGTKIGHSLNLASDISVNYVVPQAELAGYDSFYLECLLPVYGPKGIEGSTKVCIDPVERDGYYYFTLDGLTALQMNDVIEATLHMEKDGRPYYSEPDFYSIAQYAYTQLGKTGIPAQMESLCLELLRYGSAAQIYKGYRTDTLADAALTEEQKALLTDLSAVVFGNTNCQRQDLSTPTAKWVGKTLILDSNVTLRYVVNLSGYEDVLDTVAVRIRYTDYTGKEQTAILTEACPHSAAQGCYSFDLDSLPAAELRTVLYAAVYAGDTQISNTMEYSMDTYGANKAGTLDTLCRALMAYSDSAKAYFAETKA